LLSAGINTSSAVPSSKSRSDPTSFGSFIFRASIGCMEIIEHRSALLTRNLRAQQLIFTSAETCHGLVAN